MDNAGYSKEELQYMLKRTQQAATTMDLGIPIEEEGISDDELASIATLLHETTDGSKQWILMKILGYGASDRPGTYTGALDPFLRGPISWDTADTF